MHMGATCLWMMGDSGCACPWSLLLWESMAECPDILQTLTSQILMDRAADAWVEIRDAGRFIL